jgi:hypothetical protein
MSARHYVRVLSLLPLRERRAVRARVRWLANNAGRSEVEVLALTLYRVRATDRAGMTLHATDRLDALDRLLTSEIDVSGR